MGQGAEGVGLYRTEFLFLHQPHFPTEDEQAADYTAVARGAGEHGVIIRTLDIGGDKLPAGADGPAEGNPFLGWRGIRRSLQQPELFRTQLRAILRAAAHGQVNLLVPMLGHVREIRQTLSLIDHARAQLDNRGAVYGAVKLGAMIEVPAAAIGLVTNVSVLQVRP